MDEEKSWIHEIVPLQEDLTRSVESTLKTLLNASGIPFLSVTGRTKTADGIAEKIDRKRYNSPRRQMTDISGVRVVVYFERDVERVGALVKSTFKVDRKNSLDKGQLLDADQNGYRSVHYVCDIGTNRGKLPEFRAFRGLKFELQVRTVLQHAWAELAHDRNYKFAGRLPREIERELFLYAGMLEIADRGFNQLAEKIDAYAADTQRQTVSGKLDVEVNSITLPQYILEWAKTHKFPVRQPKEGAGFSDVIAELAAFGVRTIGELAAICPPKYVEVALPMRTTATVFGVVRDWMLITDHKKLHKTGKVDWVISQGHAAFFKALMSKETFADFRQRYEFENFDDA